MRPRSASVAGSTETSSRVSIRSANSRSISAGEIAAASRMRACAALPDQFGGDDERLARKRQGRIEHGAASIREQEAALPAAAIFRDAIRIGERQQRADARIAFVLAVAGLLRPPPRHAARFLGAARTIAAELIEPVRQIDVVAAEPALGDQHRHLRGRSPAPSRAASTTMRASRGGSGSARRLRPSSVMRPSASSADNSVSSLRASE